MFPQLMCYLRIPLQFILLVLLFSSLVSSSSWADAPCHYDNSKKKTVCKPPPTPPLQTPASVESNEHETHETRHTASLPLYNPCHYDFSKKKTVCRPPPPPSQPSSLSGVLLKDDKLSTSTSHDDHGTSSGAPPSDHIKDLNHILVNASQKEMPLLIPHTDFFQTKGGKKGGKASWDYISHTPEEYAHAWHSSWSSDADEHGYPKLCEPFEEWVKSSYIPMSKDRAPVRCHMAPHQGLGDQLKGIMRCWSAALVTQRPLFFDHSRSRSSWLWTDKSSILPNSLVSSRVHFNSSVDFLNTFKQVEIDGQFTADMTCDKNTALFMGGITPFLGIQKAVDNINRKKVRAKCRVELEATGEMMKSLSQSRGDHSYCLIRTLMRPSDEQIQSMNVAMGQALMTASKSSCLDDKCKESGHVNSTDIPQTAEKTSSSSSAVSAVMSEEEMKIQKKMLSSIRSGAVSVVALHLRLQEDISTTLDVNWGLHCAGMVGAQFAMKANGGGGSPVVIFVLATDTPELLESIAQHLSTSPVCRHKLCSFATNEGIGDVGHISNKATVGSTSVSQRIWADWFLLSEASICVYTRSGFPRMACEASHHHAAISGKILEKGTCGVEGMKSWRLAKTDVGSLDAGCNSNSKILAESQCKLAEKNFAKWD